MNKKIIKLFLVFFLAFFLISSVRATTIESLQAKIAELTVLITSLQTQLVSQTTAPSPTEAICFYTDLGRGTRNNEVLKLQRALNLDPATRIANSGAGAPGSETTYFSSLTLAAVKAFQAKHGIITTGYVGPLTRAKLNNLYCVSTTTTTLPSCQWCGSACLRLYPSMVCPDVAPPAGYYCGEFNNQCIVSLTPNITLTTTTTTTTIPIKYTCNPTNWQCVLTYGGGQYDTLTECQARCQAPTTTTTTSTTIPIKYTCNPTNWQCVLTYGGGQYDTLTECQARCQAPTTTTTTLPSCQWCGDQCTRVYPDMVCPNFVPKTPCCERDGECVSGFACFTSFEQSDTINNSISNLMASLASIIESLKEIIK